MLENELNYIAIRDMLTNIEEILEKHGKTEKRAHNAEQIVYTLPTGPNVTVGQELGYQSKRIRNLVLGTIGNGLQVSEIVVHQLTLKISYTFRKTKT